MKPIICHYFPVVSGCQRETEGKHLYDEVLDSYFAKGGMFSELITFQYLGLAGKANKLSSRTRDNGCIGRPGSLIPDYVLFYLEIKKFRKPADELIPVC